MNEIRRVGDIPLWRVRRMLESAASGGIKPTAYQKRNRVSSRRVTQKLLFMLALGWIEPVGEKNAPDYVLTQQGRAIMSGRDDD